MTTKPTIFSAQGARSKPSQLRLHRFVSCTEVEGPGKRAALWVQGCPIRCPGCFNPQTWSARGGDRISVSEIAQRILSDPLIEGVSFLGGEPFAQAAPLAELGSLCREAGLSVVTFSGYEAELLLGSARSDWRALLSITDVLLAGPFLQDQLDLSRPWVGSRNQRFVYLTDRYRDLENQPGTRPTIEFQIDETGRLQLNGMLDSAGLAALEAELAAFGLGGFSAGAEPTCEQDSPCRPLSNSIKLSRAKRRV